MLKLLLLFVVLPVLELQLLVAVGVRLGVLPTVLLVLATGLAGAALARREGLAAWRRISAELAAGRVPADALLEGAVILVAGVLLLTPGFLTDAFGLLCLLPPTRAALLAVLRRRLDRAVREGRVKVHVSGGRWPGAADEPPILDRDVIQHEPPASGPPR